MRSRACNFMPALLQMEETKTDFWVNQDSKLDHQDWLGD